MIASILRSKVPYSFFTNISQEQELEIAKMIAGDQVTETSLAGARELLKR